MSGGSSSGCGAATAAGLAPVSLGSDTNGSIRVPASLCGVFSLKPTFGRLPRTGTFPFVDSLDHLGPFARTAARPRRSPTTRSRDRTPADPGCAARPAEPVTPGLADARRGCGSGCSAAGSGQRRPGGAAPRSRGPPRRSPRRADVEPLTLDQAEAGRAAAYLITNAESADFHLARLRERAADFDPETRDRFLAGALLPAAWVARARRVRRWWLEQALEAFAGVDLLLAPATPCPAPPIGTKSLTLAGRVPSSPPDARASVATLLLHRPAGRLRAGLPGNVLPVGVQIVAPPWREDLCLATAHRLEIAGVAEAQPPAALSREPARRAG